MGGPLDYFVWRGALPAAGRPHEEMSRTRVLAVLGLLVLAALAVSGIAPYDRATWVMEVGPVLIGVPLLFATSRRFPLTTLLYALIALHALVLILGGAYTYARVPLGFWLQELCDLERNPYDRIGHFMQGFVPALLAREVLLRGSYVSGRRMAAFLSGCVALAVSALYELVEWWAALALGQGADAFLGTQGDPWDTQSDMFMALVGAVVALLASSRATPGSPDRRAAGNGPGVGIRTVNLPDGPPAIVRAPAAAATASRA